MIRQEERWLLIPNGNGCQVSTFGRVIDAEGNELKQKLDGEGYPRVRLKSGDLPVRVHKLVIMFLPEDRTRPLVDHIDRDRTNNHLSNLRRVTHHENNMNTDYSGRYFGKIPIVASKGGHSKVFESTEEAARYLGLNSKSINKVLKGHRKSLKNYKFKYLED